MPLGFSLERFAIVWLLQKEIYTITISNDILKRAENKARKVSYSESEESVLHKKL